MIVTKTCQVCGKEYAKRGRPSAREVTVSKYCSMTCQRIGNKRPAAERFWEKVQKTDGCWLWTGHRQPSGYGTFYRDEKKRQCKASHFSWEFHHGPIPAGLWVLHKCDNPPCVRPDHLFLGDRSANVRDSVEKGRHWATRKTHCKHGHALTPDNIYYYENGRKRHCKACNKRITRQTYERRRASR